MDRSLSRPSRRASMLVRATYKTERRHHASQGNQLRHRLLPGRQRLPRERSTPRPCAARCGSSPANCTAPPSASPEATRTGWRSPPSARPRPGLEVWFAPFPCELTPEEMLPYFEECAGARRGAAARAERRSCFVTGCELSLLRHGLPAGRGRSSTGSSASCPAPPAEVCGGVRRRSRAAERLPRRGGGRRAGAVRRADHLRRRAVGAHRLGTVRHRRRGRLPRRRRTPRASARRSARTRSTASRSR